ncbi:MAG: Cupin domain protein [Methanomassiliicoccales archaeon PtaU1.Bin124]|nr:MAG: Cupin domain protein [Methanomassiliicoccales archaeon PtaU1.Bin124]
MAKDVSGMVDLEGKRPDLRGKALVTKDLLNYQEGAVVSRTLIDKKVGTLTVFSFDEGQGLSEHTAPYDATVMVLDGQVEITVSGNKSVLEEGEMMIMPANEPHALRALKPFKMMLIMIRA